MNTTRIELTTGGKNVVRLLASGIDPVLKGMSAESLKSAHYAGLINWKYDHSGQGWTLSARGQDFCRAEGFIV